MTSARSRRVLLVAMALGCDSVYAPEAPDAASAIGDAAPSGGDSKDAAGGAPIGGAGGTTAVGGDGGGVGGSGTPATPLQPPRAFQVTGKFTLNRRGPGMDIVYRPEGQAFTLFLDPGAHTITLGNDGSLATAPVTSEDGVTWRTTAPLMLEVVPAYLRCNGFPSVVYDHLELTVNGDALSGVATGVLAAVMGDVVTEFDARLDMTGAPDVTPPSFATEPVSSSGPDFQAMAATPIDPLQPLAFRASEPLPGPLAAHLEAVGGGSRVPLDAKTESPTSPVIRLEKGPLTALLYGTTYQLVVAPWADLGGRAGDKQGLPTFTTQPAPALVAPDGFEAVAGDSVGGAAVIGPGVLPPVSGQRSLFLAPFDQWVPPNTVTPFPGSTSFTARLALKGGEKVLRARLRTVSWVKDTMSSGGELPAVLVAAPGGTITWLPLRPDTTPPERFVLGPAYKGLEAWLGPVTAQEVALPAGTAGEIVVHAYSIPAQGACNPFGRAGLGLLLDDLRAE